MQATFESLIREWDGLAVVTHRDPPTGTWIFVALHDDTLGRPVGGCRMKVYETPAEGLRDALRLARGMTFKWAAIDFDFGGGKSVLAVPRVLEGEERHGLLRRFGRLLDSLQGAYATGEDLGTTPEDMAVIASASDHVMGVDRGGAPADPGPFTALGVFSGMRVALEHVFGAATFEGRTVLVQGVGDVGAPLARRVAEAGGRVLITDLDRERGERTADEIGGELVAPDEAIGASCDIFAPCAVGGVLNRETIPRLRCSIVAGSANNQLEEAADANRLHERGIVYAPDYVVNAGGALAFGLMNRGIRDREEIRERVRGLGTSLRSILREARERGESPLYAAQRKVEAVLSSSGRPARETV